MSNAAALSARHAELRRAQRAAYFAWQNAPAGQGSEPLAAYEAASAALANFNRDVAA